MVIIETVHLYLPKQCIYVTKSWSNVIQRINDGGIPTNIKYGVILCGTNNCTKFTENHPLDVARVIVEIALTITRNAKKGYRDRDTTKEGSWRKSNKSTPWIIMLTRKVTIFTTSEKTFLAVELFIWQGQITP